MFPPHHTALHRTTPHRTALPCRRMPQDWDLPITDIPTSTSTSSAAAGPGQGHDNAISFSSSSSRQASPLVSPAPFPFPSPTKGFGVTPSVPPQMQRVLTEPCTAHSSARSLPSPRKEGVADLCPELVSGDVLRTPATAASRRHGAQEQWQEQEEETGLSRGRPSELGKSKSLSPMGKWGGIGTPGRSVSVEREGRGDRRREASRSASPAGRRVSACAGRVWG